MMERRVVVQRGFGARSCPRVIAGLATVHPATGSDAPPARRRANRRHTPAGGLPANNETGQVEVRCVVFRAFGSAAGMGDALRH